MQKISLKSRRKLQPQDARHFAGLNPPLFADLAAAVCSAGVLPQKELHECWQMGLRVHQEFPEVRHVVDIAAGHGLLAWILVLLARHSNPRFSRTAVALDISRPKSANVLAAALAVRWPDLAESVHYVEGGVDAVTSDDRDAQTIFVAAHACGSLSDRVLLAAIAGNNPVAIMPCCHSLRKQGATLSALAHASGLSLASPAAIQGHPASIDQFRKDALSALGYQVRDGTIDPEISAFNRIIMGVPPKLSHLNRPVTLQARFAETTASQRGRGIRAYETVQSINVNDTATTKMLALRPSREWQRSFDLSFWLLDETSEERFAETLKALSDRFLTSPDLIKTVSIRDHYTDPATRRRAFTYRIELKSYEADINKQTASELRAKLCRSMRLLSHLSKIHPALRS